MTTAKKLFFVMHFIGVGISIIGFFVNPLVVFGGIFWTATNAVIMGICCDVEFN